MNKNNDDLSFATFLAIMAIIIVLGMLYVIYQLLNNNIPLTK
jgi:hypothetical protein